MNSTRIPETDAAACRRDKSYWEEHLADQLRLSGQAEWLKYSREHYADWVRQYLTGGQRVLKTDAFEEIRGSEVLEALFERYAQVVVADLAFPAVFQASKRSQDSRPGWVQTPAQLQPFAERSFDAVTSFSTLDHFQTPIEIGRSLRELARVTRLGGQLLITLDNSDNPIVAIRNLIPSQLLKALKIAPYEYGKTLGKNAFLQVLEEAGWEVLHYTAVVHEPRALAVAAAKYCREDGWLTPTLYRRAWRPFLKLERFATRWWSGYFLLAVCERRA